MASLWISLGPELAKVQACQPQVVVTFNLKTGFLMIVHACNVEHKMRRAWAGSSEKMPEDGKTITNNITVIVYQCIPYIQTPGPIDNKFNGLNPTAYS